MFTSLINLISCSIKHVVNGVFYCNVLYCNGLFLLELSRYKAIMNVEAEAYLCHLCSEIYRYEKESWLYILYFFGKKCFRNFFLAYLFGAFYFSFSWKNIHRFTGTERSHVGRSPHSVHSRD